MLTLALGTLLCVTTVVLAFWVTGLRGKVEHLERVNKALCKGMHAKESKRCD